MSSQTVVDVVISGTTATVVDAQVDGITTVAGTPQVTNVSGQIPDLGVTTSYLAGQGEILSLTNDITNLRANVIITGQTLTDEIGVLSGVLISTGNYLESNTLTLSGDLITTGQTLQTQITSNISNISTLTANLLTTGQTLSDEKFDKSGGTLAGNVLPNVTETLDLGSSDKKWNNLYVKDAHIDSSTLFLGTGGANIKVADNKIKLEGNSATAGTQFVGDVNIDAGTLYAQKAFGPQFKILNTNATNLYEFHLDDDGHLNISGNLEGDVKFADPVTIEGSLAVKASQTGVFATDAGLSTLTNNVVITGQTLQTQITSNVSDIATLDSSTVKLTTNQSIAGNKIFSDKVTINNLHVTGTEVIVDVENLAVKDNLIHINSGENGAGISRISGGITIDRGTEASANILYNDANDRFELNFPLALEGDLAVTANQTGVYATAANLITTGQTLQTQVTSNDSDISTLTANLATTGATLTSEVGIVSGLITDNDGDITALKTATGVLKTSTDANTSNLISTGNFLESEISIVSGIAGGQDLADLSGNLITTGQTLTTDINAVSSNLVLTGSIVDDISGNLITTGQALQTQITSNDTDISNLTSNLVTTGQTLTSEIAIVSGIAGGDDLINISGKVNTLSGDLITTGQTLTTNLNVLSSNLISTGTVVDDISGNLISTGNTLTSEIAIVSGIATGGSAQDFRELSGNLIITGQTLTTDINALQTQITNNDADITNVNLRVDSVVTNLISTGTVVDDISGNLITTGQTLQTQISSNDNDISDLSDNLGITGQTLITKIDNVHSYLLTTGQYLTAEVATVSGNVDTLSGNLITTGQYLTDEIAIVSGIAGGGGSDPALSGKVDTLSGNLITTGQTLQTQITSSDGDISTLTTNLISTGSIVDDISGNLITTGQTLQTQITSNDTDISNLTSNLISTGTIVDNISGNLITTGQTLQTQITSNDSEIAQLQYDVEYVDSTLTTNLNTTGQTLTTNINTVSTNLISTGSIVDDISGNLIATGQTLQTQITNNDGDITNLTSNLITTGQTLTTEITTVSGLITDNDGDITALKAATGVLKTSTDNNTANLISTGAIVDDISGNLITSGQTLQTQITSNDSDISTLTSNVITTGQTLQTQITSNDGDISTLTSNLITTGQTLQTQITSNDSDISTLTSNLISTGSVVDDVSGNLITTGQTLQTQITSNDSDISTLTSNLVTTGQTLTTNVNTVSSNLVSTGSVVDDISGNLITTGQTLQTQITSNDGDISTLTTNLGTTGQTLQTQITSNDADIATLDSTTVKLTTNQSVAGNKIFTDKVTINNLTVTGTEVIVDVENLAVKDNIIHINSGESGAGISRISGGITIDRGTEPSANILYNDANDRFELNFPLATEGNVVASAANLITTGQTLTTNINTVSTNLVSTGSVVDDISGNLITTGQTLQTQITANDTDIATNVSNISSLTTNLVTTGQTLQTQITSNDSDISTLTSNLSTTNSNLVTTGQTLTTNINTVSTNLVSTGSIVDDISGNLITTGQTLQTQITSNDTDITNLSSNLVTTGQTLTTNINTVATNLVTTGQTLTSEIATVSGLIPATVIDGGGTANKVPLWSDANTIGDSVISQSSSKIGIGINAPSHTLSVGTDLGSISSDTAVTIGSNGDSHFIMGEDANNHGKLSWDASENSWEFSLTHGGSAKYNALVIDQTGYVGIGTHSPSRRFTVEGASGDNLPVRIIGGASTTKSGLEFQDPTTTADYKVTLGSVGDNMFFQAGGSERIRILADGNVGIGTTAPQSLLHVNGPADGTGYLKITDSVTGAGGGDGMRLGYNSGELRLQNFENSDIAFFLQTTERVTFKSDGNVGIGTNAPAFPLDILSNTGFRIGPSSNALLIRGDQGGGDWNIDATHGSAHIFLAFGGTRTHVFKEDGKVGINTVTSTYDLKVQGTSKITGTLSVGGVFSTDTSTTLGTIAGNSHTVHGTLDLDDSKLTLGGSGGTAGYHLQTDGSGNISWQPGGAGTVTGTGTDNYIPKWNGTTALENSSIWDSGSTVYMSRSSGLAPLVLMSNPANQVADIGGELIFQATYRATSDTTPVARIKGSRENATTNNWKGKLTFHTSPGGDSPSASTERMRINGDGNVGIGTTTPDQLVHLNKSAGETIVKTEVAANSTVGFEIKKTGSTTQNWRIVDGQTVNGVLEFYDATDSATRMAIKGDGKVGIGTVTPSYQLSVEAQGNDDGYLLTNASATTLAELKQEDSDAGRLTLFDGGAVKISLNADASQSNYFNNGGSFGIGTAAPGGVSKLEVQRAARTTAFNAGDGDTWHDLIVRNPTNSTNAASGIAFVMNNTYHKNAGTGIAAIAGPTSDYSASLAFITRPHADYAAERMRIQYDGNVGIGTTDPSYRLEVVAATSSDSLLVSAGGNGKWRFTGDGVGYWGNALDYGHFTWDTGRAIFGALSGKDLAILAGGAEKVTILTDGKVGIGTDTPTGVGDILLHIKDGSASNQKAELKVQGNYAAGLYIENGDARARFYSSHGSNDTYGGFLFEIGSQSAKSGTEIVRFWADGDAQFTSTANRHNYHYINTATAGYNPILGLVEAGTRRAYINYVSADNYLSITTEEGSSDIAIMAAGKVGVGTTNPENAFEVKKSVTGSWVSRIYNTATTGNPYGLLVRVDKAAAADTHFGVYNGSAHTFAVKGDGNVGIGTAAPAQKLHIYNGRIAVSDGYNIGDPESNNGMFISGDSVQWQTGGTTMMKLQSTGYVDMDGASQVRLTLGSQGTAGNDDSNWIRGNGTSLGFNAAGGATTWEVSGAQKMSLSSTGALVIQDALTVNGNISNAAASAYYYLNNVGTGNSGLYVAGLSSRMRFHVPASNYYEWEIGGAHKMRLDAGGNVGIGTATPVANLHIYEATTDTPLQITRAANTGNAMIKFETGTTDDWIVGLRNDSTSDFRFYSYGTSSDVFSINRADGNVGIGTTAPNTKLVIVGPGGADVLNLHKGTGVGGIKFTFNGTNYISYIRTFEAGTQASNYMSFGVSTGNNTTSVEAMRLTGDGYTVKSRTVQALQDGACYKFNGVHQSSGGGDYILLASDGRNGFSSQHYTVAGWIKLGPSRSSDSVIFSYDHTGHSSPYYAIQVRVGINGSMLFAWNNGSTYKAVTSSAGDFADDTWHHFACTYTSGTQKIYADGVQVAAATETGTITFYQQEVYIGRASDVGSWGGGAFFEGSMRAIQYFPSTLSAGDVQKLYNGENPKRNTKVDLLTNGDFSSASGWTVGNWTISGGKAIASDGDGYMTQGSVLNTSKKYLYTIKLDAVSGNLYIYSGTGAPGAGGYYTAFSSPGTYTFIANAYNSTLGLYCPGGTTATVDSIRAEEITTLVDLTPHSGSPTVWYNSAVPQDRGPGDGPIEGAVSGATLSSGATFPFVGGNLAVQDKLSVGDLNVPKTFTGTVDQQIVIPRDQHIAGVNYGGTGTVKLIGTASDRVKISDNGTFTIMGGTTSFGNNWSDYGGTNNVTTMANNKFFAAINNPASANVQLIGLNTHNGVSIAPEGGDTVFGGCVGIGTTAPSALLTVKSPLVSQHAIYSESNTAYGSPLYLNDIRNDTSMEHLIQLKRNTNLVGYVSSDATHLVMNAPRGYMILDGADGTIMRDSGSNKVIQNGSYFRPDGNNDIYLGSSSARWANVYSVAGNFSGNLVLRPLVLLC